MNCAISGSAGLAFLLDGKRASLLRGVEGEPVPCSLFDFHRLFAEVTDCIFLEGADISTARARLKRASTASDSLSLALRLLDGSFDAELRTEIAADLEPLLRAQDAKDDLAAVLAAAPFPPDVDLPGALTACESAGAQEGASLLTELRDRQNLIREVRQAWDAIPHALFGDAERRREARAQAVRGGLFLQIVRARARGERLENVLVDALADRSVPRWIPSRSHHVLKAWMQTWVSDASGVQSEPVEETSPSDEDLPRARRRERGRAKMTTRPVSRSPGAWELVRETINKFVGELGAAHEAGTRAVSELVKRTRTRIQELQGSRPEDRPHFAKSLSNMATSLREVGEEIASLDLLEWAWRRRAVDAVSYSLLVDTYGKAGDLVRAQEVFEEAHAAGLADEFTYSTLVDAYGKTGDVGRAQEVFEAARAAGLANAVTYNALVDAYGKTGDVRRAQEVFEAARAAGLADEFTYSTLVDAYGKAGDVGRAQEVFEVARAAGLANAVTYNALVDAHGKAGDVGRAQEVFEAACAAGLANEFTYGTLVDAYGKAGDVGRAQEVFEAARAAGLANEFTYSTLLDAYGKAGDVGRAQEVFEAARTAGLADAVTHGALVDAYGKAGDVGRAQEVFEAARAAGLANEVTCLIWFAAVARQASASRIAAAIELIASQYPPDRPAARALADAIAWAAGRHGRPDWLERLPDAARSASVLFAYALRTTDVDRASSLMSQYGTRAAAATMLLRYRRLGTTASATELSALVDDCRRIREGTGSLDAFTLIRLTEIEGRCLRRVDRWTEVRDRWVSCEHLVVPRIETRATLLAESGRALLVLGLRRGDGASAREGAHRLLNGWSFARSLNPADPQALLASAHALGGFGDAKDEVSLSPPDLAMPIRAILAEGARDGRWTAEAVQASDLPDDYLLPALRGIEFLHEMKEGILRESTNAVC